MVRWSAKHGQKDGRVSQLRRLSKGSDAKSTQKSKGWTEPRTDKTVAYIVFGREKDSGVSLIERLQSFYPFAIKAMLFRLTRI